MSIIASKYSLDIPISNEVNEEDNENEEDKKDDELI
jgi:hypothetical protein